jgi:hypothetical protein
MNQFDLLKSHIDAYTRKDGAVVGAHDDNRTKKSNGESVRSALSGKVPAGYKVSDGSSDNNVDFLHESSSHKITFHLRPSPDGSHNRLYTTVHDGKKEHDAGSFPNPEKDGKMGKAVSHSIENGLDVVSSLKRKGVLAKG